ncbi:Actin-interacting protein 1 [Aphelenchoides fujianensis]|nr:Actin-interacting protein 1 [Aphelenchoides fujianensis]
MTEQTDIVHVNTFASLPRTTRGLPLVLAAKADGSTLLYCNGNSVSTFGTWRRDITKTDIYTEHATQTTVAKYAPSGFYIASGDQSGKVRIWDTTQSTHILKAEYPVIGGPIRDIAWDSESKRIAAVGEARERFGHVFLFDTGTSNGSLSGQSRPMSSVDFKPNRPFRVVSGSEDYTVALFEGAALQTFHEHTRFVHCVRYKHDGSLFASAGADGRVVFFEGTDGTKVGELVDSSVKGEAAHSGGVFALAWCTCGKKIATASGDKTVKIWNVESRELLKTVTFSDDVNSQQVAIVWTEKWIVSTSLAGFLTYIDPDEGTIKKVIKGHNRPITAMTLSKDKTFLFTADFEGNITRWETKTGVSERIEPSPHKAQISGLALTPSGTLISVGWDDTIAFTEKVFDSIDKVKSEKQKLASQPRGIAVSSQGDTSVVIGHRHVFVFVKSELKSTLEFAHDGACIALSGDEKLVAVGSQDSKLRIYELSGNKLTEKKTITHTGALTSAQFSPDGKHLVVTDTARRVVPYSIADDYKQASAKDWTFHTARVNCAAWSPNGRYIASAGLDTNLHVYDLQKSGEHPLVFKGAHSMSQINGVVWLDDTTILTVGQDSNVKQWSVKV